MNLNRMSSSFVIENSERERYAFNLVHFFLDKEEYTIFNFEEKILENFNHDYYNIVYIYTHPLINDVNIETLFEKIDIIKKRLQKQFFLFNQRILILATNTTMDVKRLDIPDNIDIINATEREHLLHDDLIQSIYPDLTDNYPLNLDFETISIKLNSINVLYAKKINRIFNKNQFLANAVLIFLILSVYFTYMVNPKWIDYLVLTKANLSKGYFYTMITNHLYDNNLISIAISILFILTFGIRLEKIYGTVRFLGIMILTMILSSAMILAMIDESSYLVSFTPMIFSYVGSFLYVVMQFRRFLAHMIKRLFFINGLLLLFILLFGDALSLVSLISALFSGFVASFIIGIKEAKNGNVIHRILAFIFLCILVSLSVSIGLK